MGRQGTMLHWPARVAAMAARVPKEHGAKRAFSNRPSAASGSTSSQPPLLAIEPRQDRRPASRARARGPWRVQTRPYRPGRGDEAETLRRVEELDGFQFVA